MARKVSEPAKGRTRQRSRPSLSPESRENQLIALAVDLAEEQLANGTASQQVITHFLKLGAEKEKHREELEIMREQRKLLEAKTKALESQAHSEELYAKALEAMRSYGAMKDD